MNRSHVLVLLFQLFGSIWCSKNILLLVIDDLRPSLKCFGDIEAVTPNIDQLSRGSASFYRAYSQEALCAPSRISFLTSRRPDSLHLYDFYNYWRTFTGNFTTLPQYFKQNGFHTISLGKIFHPGISSNYTDDYPLSWSEIPWHPPSEVYHNALTCPDGYGLSKNVVCPVDVELQPGHTLPDIETTEKAISYLKLLGKNQSQPWLLAVGLHKPHLPLKYPKHFKEYHPLNNISLPGLRTYPPLLPTVAWNPWSDLRERHDIQNLNITFPYNPLPDNWIKLIRQSYFSAVTYIDDLIGQILEHLSDLNLDMDTTVLLVGDHGWSLGEHGEWAKYSNFESAVRVPLIIRIPNITYFGKNQKQQPIHSKELVELVDIFPTLVDLFNLNTLPICTANKLSDTCTEGASLLPLIKSEMAGNLNLKWKTAAFSQYPRPGVVPTLHPNSDKPKLKQITIMGYTMRTKQFRYTEWVKWNYKTFQPNWTQVVGTEMYDHFIDPEENLNLHGRVGLENMEKKLSDKLKAGWRKAMPS